MTDENLDSAQKYQEVVNWIDSCGHRHPLAGFSDGVNEPLRQLPDSNYKKAFGGNGATGWDWVVNAFKLARQYWSSNTKLLIAVNDLLNENISR